MENIENVDIIDSTDTSEEVDTQETTRKEETVPVSELKRRLERQTRKANEQIENLKKEFEEELKKAKMDEAELKTYQQEEQQRKLDEALAKIQDLENEKAQAELKDNAIKTMTEQGLPVNDKTLSMVLRGTPSETLDAIANLNQILAQTKVEFAKTTAPTTSYSGSSNANDFDIAAFARENRIKS